MHCYTLSYSSSLGQTYKSTSECHSTANTSSMLCRVVPATLKTISHWATISRMLLRPASRLSFSPYAVWPHCTRGTEASSLARNRCRASRCSRWSATSLRDIKATYSAFQECSKIRPSSSWRYCCTEVITSAAPLEKGLHVLLGVVVCSFQIV